MAIQKRGAMGAKIFVKEYDSIERILSKIRAACMDTNIAGEVKKRQYYIKPAAARHEKKKQLIRIRKFKKKKNALIEKFGARSLPQQKKRKEVV